MTIQAYVFKEIEQALGFNEAIYATNFIGNCENKKWNTDIVVREPNRTLSYGIWMINSIHTGTKYHISNVDKLDYKKATEWSIQKRIRDGSWLAWTCAK